MAKDYVTFILDDELTLDEFTSSIVEFNSIILNLTKEVSGGKEIRWELGGLSYGSAQAMAKGIYETEEEKEIVIKTVKKYEQYSEDISKGEIKHYSKELRKSAVKIIDISKRIPLRFETEDKDVYLYKPNESFHELKNKNFRNILPDKVYGSVRGRVESINSRNEYRFVLYDSVYDKAVSCYLNPDQKELMRNIWDSLAFVEGIVKRDINTGRPLTVRNISKIEKIEEMNPDEWKEAIGCCPVPKNSITPGEAIDKIRNEEI